MWGVGCGVWGVGCGVCGVGCGVCGVWCGMKGWGFGAWGKGLGFYLQMILLGLEMVCVLLLQHLQFRLEFRLALRPTASIRSIKPGKPVNHPLDGSAW